MSLFDVATHNQRMHSEQSQLIGLKAPCCVECLMESLADDYVLMTRKGYILR